MEGALHIASEGIHGDWWSLALITSPLDHVHREHKDASGCSFCGCRGWPNWGRRSAREIQGDFSPVNRLFRPQMLGKCQVWRSASGKLQSADLRNRAYSYPSSREVTVKWARQGVAEQAITGASSEVRLPRYLTRLCHLLAVWANFLIIQVSVFISKMGIILPLLWDKECKITCLFLIIILTCLPYYTDFILH